MERAMSIAVQVTGTEGRLTPDEVRSMAFPAARFGRRGLDEEHVRAFCARVEAEIVFLLNERASLYQHAELLRRQVTEENGEPGYTPEAAHVQAVQILANAQQTADRLVRDAQQYCRELANGAKARRDQMLDIAQGNAAKIMAEAEAEARAAAASASAAQDGRLGEHGNPQEEMAYLRTFSQVYRAHLRAYLEALLRNVDDWGRAEHEAMGVPGQARPGR